MLFDCASLNPRASFISQRDQRVNPLNASDAHDKLCSKARGHMQTEVTRKLFTVDEYYRMADAGIFDEDSRVELIEGEIIQMSPVGNRHVACVDRATSLFVTKLAGKAIVSVQNPIRLSNYTEPQPDIVTNSEVARSTQATCRFP